MSDLRLLEVSCGPTRGPGVILTVVRRGARRVLRPWLVRLTELLDGVNARVDEAETRLSRAEWQAEVFRKQTEGLSAHLEGLGRDHLNLQARFESRVVQLAAVANSFPGVDRRLDELDEKLNAFQSLHWDHVALTRRLAAIEDALSAVGDAAKSALDAGAGRPLLPFPGLDDRDEDTARSMVS